jgi:hypothetical protein
VNPAPAHLESKLRFFDLSVGQIAVVFVGVLAGMAWAKFLCPVGGMWGAVSGVYIGAVPCLPVLFASQTDFDLWLVVQGAVRWRRREGRYLPGPGGSCTGYRTVDPDANAHVDPRCLPVDFEALWEDG